MKKTTNIIPPSFTRKDTRSNILLAIDSVDTYLDDNRSSHVSFRTLQEWFGRRNTAYLSKYLIRCTNSNFSKTEQFCKKYVSNRMGIHYLRYRINYPTINMSYKEFEVNPIIDPNIQEMDKVTKIITRLRRYDEEFISGEFNMKFKSNRYHHGSHNAMRIPRAMYHWSHGYVHQHDIAACAPTAISEYAKSLGFSEEVPAYDAYMTDQKVVIRNKLAQSIDMDVHHIKIIINALYCGASLARDQRKALYKHISKHYSKEFPDDASMVRVYSKSALRMLQIDPYMKELMANIKVTWDFIKIHRPEWQGIEVIGCKEKWQLYFELENQIMTSIKEFIATNHGDIKYIQEHDGFTSTGIVDIKNAIIHVKESTGYSINLEYAKHNFKDSFRKLINDNSLSMRDLEGELCSSPEPTIMSDPLRSSPIMTVSFLYSFYLIHTYIMASSLYLFYIYYYCVHSRCNILINKDHFYHKLLYDST